MFYIVCTTCNTCWAETTSLIIFSKKINKTLTYQYDLLGIWGTFICSSLKRPCIALHYVLLPPPHAHTHTHNKNFRALIIKSFKHNLTKSDSWYLYAFTFYINNSSCTKLHIFSHFGPLNKMYVFFPSPNMSSIYSLYHTLWTIKAWCIKYDTKYMKYKIYFIWRFNKLFHKKKNIVSYVRI